MLTSENIRAVIRETVMGVDAAAMTDAQTFRSAGVDSLDAINILMALEERRGGAAGPGRPVWVVLCRGEFRVSGPYDFSARGTRAFFYVHHESGVRYGWGLLGGDGE